MIELTNRGEMLWGRYIAYIYKCHYKGQIFVVCASYVMMGSHCVNTDCTTLVAAIEEHLTRRQSEYQRQSLMKISAVLGVT